MTSAGEYASAGVDLAGANEAKARIGRLVAGTRTALSVGFLASFLGSTIGAVIGVISAYFGGKVDLVIQRIMDVLLSFPIIILAITVVAVLGKNIVLGIDVNLVLAIGFPMIPKVARVVRSASPTRSSVRRCRRTHGSVTRSTA